MTRVNGEAGGDGSSDRRNTPRVNILLVGSRAADADEIKMQLGLITGLACTAWYCSDPEEAMDFLSLKDFNIDLIFLDMGMFSVNYPKEYFLQMKASIPDIPIIVMTERTDFDLINFVMTEGAAENVSLWQLRSDPDRLRNIVDSCRARDTIIKRERLLNTKELQAAYAKRDECLSQASEKAASELKLAQELSATNLKVHQDKGKAELLEVRNAGDEAMKRSHSANAANMQASNSQIAALRRNRKKTSADMQSLRDKGAADLKEAHDEHDKAMEETHSRNDAILKYAQDKSAIELKKSDDVIKALREYNNYAREWLSGSYSCSPQTKDSADEKSDDDPSVN